ncbi:MAG: thioredoxin domain-containing protein, partial [Ferruginibacter sp.]
LLISIGYASCHWCHQMEKESFMDTAVARMMNNNFVCIKVDREERPDIDNIYMNACQLISGNSGWPLNAFALSDGKPFFAGTYYSKPGWISLLIQISQAYKNQHQKVLLQAQSLSHGIAQQEFSVLSDSSNITVDKKMYGQLFANIYQKMDTAFGGWKGLQKFTDASAIEFLLQYYFFTKDRKALDAVNLTLTKMALGGIYDQVGGGFARYATDSLWHIPHFEKMLYDNTQLISVYAHAYQLTGNVFYKKILQETITFIQRDLSDGRGGYYSSLNADTDNEEGSFYSWTMPDLRATIPDQFKLVSSYYNLSDKGNFKPGQNILYAERIAAEFASLQNINPAVVNNQLEEAKIIMLAKRNKRQKPAVDTKVLTSWNALLITGFLDAYAALGDKAYLEYALAGAHFIEDKMQDNSGKLWRNRKDDKRSVDAFLDDYALLATAYLRLYQLTFDKHWLLQSKTLVTYALQNLYDPASGMFYYSNPHSDTNLVRKIQTADNSIPASNSAMATVLYKLGIYFDNPDYQEKSREMVSKMSDQLLSNETRYFTSWCSLAGLFAYGTNEVAIMGSDVLIKNIALQKNYLPASIFMGSASEENLPMLEGKATNGKTLIYVCTNGTCKRPEESIPLALLQLQKINNSD